MGLPSSTESSKHEKIFDQPGTSRTGTKVPRDTKFYPEEFEIFYIGTEYLIHSKVNLKKKIKIKNFRRVFFAT